MYEVNFSTIVENAPFGYAYHKIILDKKGKCIDFIYLDANEAFEKMTGLVKDKICGKSVHEVLPGLNDEGFDWFEYYEEVCCRKVSKEVTAFSPVLNRWYRITAFSPEDGYFVTYFTDVTEECKRIETLEEHKDKISDLLFHQQMVDDTTHDAMFMAEVRDGDYYYISTNKAHMELTGYNQEDVVGKTPWDVMEYEMALSVVEGYDLCLKNRDRVDIENKLKFPSGLKFLKTNLVPIIKNDEVKYIIGCRKDVTSQKLAEQQREEILLRFQSMFTDHLAIMIVTDPLTKKIKKANPAACAFYGYSMSELKGMPIHNINMMPPVVLEEHDANIMNNMKNYYIYPHRLKNGEMRLVDTYSSVVTNKGQKEIFSIIFDVTDREAYKDALYAEKELLRTTLMSIGEAVVTTDSQGRIKIMNKVAEELIGLTMKEVKGQFFSDILPIISEETGDILESPVDYVINNKEISQLQYHTALINKKSLELSIADSASPITNNDGNLTGVVVVFRDVTLEKAHEEQILFLSYHDALTGLYNRRYLEEHDQMFDMSCNLPLSVIMGDVNGLKLTNDIFGHEAGDRLLIKAADAMKSCCRPGDIIARWGGDEFVIILPGASCQIADEIVTRIRLKCLEDIGDLNLSIALGYATKEDNSVSIQRLYQDAEEFMYQVKLTEGKSYRKNSVDTLMTTLFEKSEETEGHTQRLQKYCLAIGAELNLSARKLGELELLAKLHDIGKVAISENVLNKKGPLTEAEWIEMRKHPEIGYRITQNISELAVITDYILYHHEHYDGSGYPRGLVGEEIPLLDRILAVVDAYDAMVYDRVYRKGMSKADALAEIADKSGTQFDPQVVEVFLKLVK